MTSPLRRIRRAAIAALTLGTALAVALGGGLAAPAFAASTHTLTVDVTSKSGAPLTGLRIYALPIADGLELTTVPETAGKAVSGHGGRYSFAGLADVDYTLYFETTGTTAKTAFSQLLGGESLLSRARTFPSTTTTLSVSLATNATISGKVLSPSGAALKSAVAQAYLFDGTSWIPYSYASTDSKGAYALRDIDPGSYKFEFYSPTGLYSPVFSGGKSSLDAATAIAVNVGSSTVLNARFASGGSSISGTAYWNYKNAGSYKLDRVVVAAYPVLEQHGIATKVDYDRATYSKPSGTSGRWKVAGLAPGDYVVELLPYYYNQPQAFLGWGWGNTSPDLSEAEIYSLGVGDNRQVGTSTISAGASGSALHVVATSAASGLPIAHAIVLLQRDSNPNEYYRGTTSSTGTLDLGRRKSGKTTYSVIQPGKFTLSVQLADGSFEPFSQSFDFSGGFSSRDIALQPTTIPAGFSTPPAIDATATTVGTTYSVTATPSRGDAQLSYQWLRDGHVVYGATSKTYTSRAADIGTQLSVRILAYSFGHADVSASASVIGLVTGGTKPTSVIPPTVTSHDDPHVGTALHAFSGTWSVPGLDFAYAWYRDGELISDTGRDYVIQDGDLGSRFTVRVTATKAGFPDSDEVDSSNSVVPTPGPATAPTARFVISTSTTSVPKGSLRYTVAPGTWTAPNSTFTYSWSLGGTVVGSAASYVASSSTAALAQPLTVTVSATAAGWLDGTASQVARKGTPLLTATQAPVATRTSGGTALTATSLVPLAAPISVDPGSWTHIGIAPAGLRYRYQWMRAVGKAKPVAIAGATAASYTPTVGDLAAKLTVRVTAYADEWSDASVTIPAGTVGPATALLDHVPTVTITGPGAPYSLLQVQSDDVWTAAGATVTWQWSQCVAATCSATSPASAFTKIAGQTTTAFEPMAAQADHWVRVTATATRTGYSTATLSPPAIHILPSGTLTFHSVPVIQPDYGDTSVRVGSSAHAVPVDSDEYSGDVTMTWQVCATNCDVDANWRTGTGSGSPQWGGDWGYVPSIADRVDGGLLRVVETESREGFTTTSVTSPSVPIELGYFNTGQNVYVTTTAPKTWTVNDPDVTSALGGTQTIAWMSGDTQVGTGQDYTITDADAGKPVFAVLTYDVPGYKQLVVTLVAQKGSVAGLSAAPETILGGVVDQPLSVSNPMPWTLPSNAYANWTVSYQWQVSHLFVPTSGSYTPKWYQVGGDIQVNIEATSPIYGTVDLLVTTSKKVLQGHVLDPAVAPSLTWTGDLVPGTVVHVANPPTLSDADAAASTEQLYVEYKWETSADGVTWTQAPFYFSYTPPLEDGGRFVRATVTAQRRGYPDYSYTTPAASIGTGPTIHQLAAPVLSGDFRVGGLVTLDAGDWSPGVTTKVEWLLNGNPLPGVTNARWVPLARDYGDDISVRITASQPGMLDVVTESNRERIGQALAPVATALPVISGKTVLTASTGGWSVGGLTFHYQWKLDGADVAGATDATFALPAGALRSSVSVVVTTERFGYEDGSATAH